MAKGLLHATSLFSLNTFLSRILGFIRDMVFAHYFGATAQFDAFMVAFRIPNFMRRLSAEGSFSQAFVPVLSEYRTNHTHKEVREFIDHMSGFLGTALLLITIIAIVSAPFVITLFAPGFSHQNSRYDLAVHMLRWTFPYLFFISLTALCSAILNSYDSFGIPAITPIFLNIVLILSAIFMRSYFHVPIYALAFGVFLAGIVQLLFQTPFLYYKKLLPKPRINLADKGVQRVLKLMVPALLGVSVAQISLVIDTIFASFLQEGSVSWLYYSERLMEFPLGVFGVAIATVILPKLSRHHATQNHHDYSQTLDWALRSLLLIGLPCALGILMLAGPLLSTLFQSGQFDARAVLMARKSLIAFSIGIQAFMMIKIFASGFYSRQDIKTPVKIAIIAVLVNIIFNCILILPLKHMGLALSTTISGFTNASLLLLILIKQKIYMPKPGWKLYLSRLLFANIVMVLLLLLTTNSMTIWFEHTRLWRVTHLLFLVTISATVYFLSLLMTGLRPRDILDEGIRS